MRVHAGGHVSLGRHLDGQDSLSDQAFRVAAVMPTPIILPDPASAMILVRPSGAHGGSRPENSTETLHLHREIVPSRLLLVMPHRRSGTWCRHRRDGRT